MGTGPVEYLSDFFPILHILILHCLDRCTCYNHAIELLLRKFVEILIEHHHVLNRRILGSMTLELHETHLQLQRGVESKRTKSVSVVILSGMRLSTQIFRGLIS